MANLWPVSHSTTGPISTKHGDAHLCDKQRMPSSLRRLPNFSCCYGLSMPWGIPIVTLIPLLLGLAFILAGTLTKGRSSGWGSTQGIVIPTKWGLELRRGERYRWQGPDGVVREGKGYSRTWPKPDGTPVTVVYDPENLDRFRLAADQSAGTLFIILGWIAVALSAVTLIVVLVAAQFVQGF